MCQIQLPEKRSKIGRELEIDRERSNIKQEPMWLLCCSNLTMLSKMQKKPVQIWNGLSPVFVNISGLSSVEILSPYNELPWPLCNMTCSKIDFTNYTITATKDYNELFFQRNMLQNKGSITVFCLFSLCSKILSFHPSLFQAHS